MDQDSSSVAEPTTLPDKYLWTKDNVTLISGKMHTHHKDLKVEKRHGMHLTIGEIYFMLMNSQK